jgi:FtsP/CotA-like multicopper oxidase with cupredoxin domain
VIRTMINSGETFQYDVQFPLDEPPGLYWYHPHIHGISEAAVQGGASGALIVEGIQNINPKLPDCRSRFCSSETIWCRAIRHREETSRRGIFR